MYYIGIDLGGINIAVGIVDEEGKIIKKGFVLIGVYRYYIEIMKDMVEFSFNFVKECGFFLDYIYLVGIGSFGMFDNEKGMIFYSNNIVFLNVFMREEI